MSASANAKPASALHPHIARQILLLRDQRVMLDAELAALYGVETKVLIQAVKRNAARFPADFMFQLSPEEWAALRSQFVTSNEGRGGRRYAPYVFTEHGVAMLSSVLGSERAVAISIEIMRTFVQVRSMVATHADLAQQISELQVRTETMAIQHDVLANNTRSQIRKILATLRELMTPAPSPEPPTPPKRPIGFVTQEVKTPGKPTGQNAKALAAKGKTAGRG